MSESSAGAGIPLRVRVISAGAHWFPGAVTAHVAGLLARTLASCPLTTVMVIATGGVALACALCDIAHPGVLCPRCMACVPLDGHATVEQEYARLALYHCLTGGRRPLMIYSGMVLVIWFLDSWLT